MKEATVIFSGLNGERYSPDAGGIQIAEYSFCEYASQAGWNITAIVGKSRTSDSRVTHKAKVIEIPTTPFAQGGMADVMPFSYRASSIISENALSESIVHFTSLLPAVAFINNPSFEFLRAKRKFKPRLLYTLHNYHYAIANKAEDVFKKYVDEWQFLHQSEYQIVQFVDLPIVTSSNYTAELSNKFNRKIHYIPNTIGERSSFFVKNESLESHDVILALSRIDEGKNIDLLIKAFSLALQDSSRLRLIIAGSGTELESLTSLAHNRGLDPYVCPSNSWLNNLQRLFLSHKVIFTGRIEGYEKQKSLNLADCFTQLSTREVSPLVGLENMVYGNRMLVTNIPGWLDFQEKGADIVTTDLSESHVAEAMLKACSDAKAQRKVTEVRNFRTYDKFYDPKIVIPLRLNLYERVLEGII